MSKFDQGAKALLEDTQKAKREAIEQMMKDDPKLTRAQAEAAWKQAAHQLGL